MVTPSAGTVVLLPFPFSDLSGSKLRPAVVLASAGGDDWILCQITSRPYADPRSIELVASSFVQGGLSRVSYVRPAKLFTASSRIFVQQAGQLRSEVLEQLVAAVVRLFQSRR